MAKVIRMPAGAVSGFVHFERHEISRLLDLYARRVAGGEWRDYAIDVRPDGAAFSVFRHAMERPLYVITKAPPGPRGGGWSVSRPGHGPARFAGLSEALAALERAPRPVSS